MVKIVDYFVSLGSPYTYMGGKRLKGIIDRTGATFNIKPINGAKVMAVTGGLPVAKRHPARLAYRLVELERWKTFWSLQMNIQPKYFPVDDGCAAQMVIAAQLGGQDAVGLSNIFLSCVWEDEEDISDTATLVAVANQAGFDGNTLAGKIGNEAVISEYEANTDQAIDLNVFGMPWFIYEGIPYWGQDRIEFLERALTC